jgi:Na+-transporting NADH:ubiquinone oxidoreductase subunit F
MQEVVVAVSVCTGIVVALSCLVLVARQRLVPAGDAEVTINQRRRISAARGDKLLWALAAHGVLLPSACGGRGSCGQCRLRVLSGGGRILPTEAAHISKRDAAAGERLACMVTIRGNLSIRVPDGALAARRRTCTVQSNRHIATYLKELVLVLPEGDPMAFQAGDYIQIEAPPGRSRFADFEMDAACREAWQRRGLLDLVASRDTTELRAYSMANPPGEQGIVMLVVRIATPPPGSAAGTPPGKVSSYVFGLKAGDEVKLTGPFGAFHVRDSDAEMILIGGGAGIAPLRAMIFDQLLQKHTQRKMSFWYGARSAAEICYRGEFDALSERFVNFSWQVALSDPGADTGWGGPTGFIHSVLYDHYLKNHPAPEEVEYYMCGPPLMSSAVVAMLEDLGVERERIFYDDFGA